MLLGHVPFDVACRYNTSAFGISLYVVTSRFGRFYMSLHV